MHIVFVVDTSGSMNQRTDRGPTYLDVAKQSIETFVTKIRTRDRSRQDRFMLMTYAQGAAAVKVDKFHPGFVNQQLFLQEVGKLRALDLGRPGEALMTAFELVNMDRLQNFIDTFAQGRNPCYANHAIIILYTDSGPVLTDGGLLKHLVLPIDKKPGSELVKEPFRWDQRLFTISLRMSGVHPIGPNSSDSPYRELCEATGGKLFIANSKHALHQALESVNSKIHSGVVVSLEPLPCLRPNQMQMPSALHRMILTKQGQKGHWPIPDEFWPASLPDHQIPPRSAHPVILFSQEESEPQVVEAMPFDKYELEPSPLTQHILSLKRTNICWQCFVQNSHSQEGPGRTFGYLKPSSTGTSVNLILMPYNYPKLVELVRGLFSFPKVPPSKEWQHAFESYLSGIPPYYVAPIKAGLLSKYGPPGAHLIPEHISANLKNSISNYLVKLKGQSKSSLDKTFAEIIQARETSRQISEKLATAPPDPTQPPKKSSKQRGTNRSNTVDTTNRPDLFINILNVPRDELVAQLAIARENSKRLLHSSRTKPMILREDALHKVPISSMGDYTQALKNKETVRDPTTDAAERPLTFGNPFQKLSKNVILDEAESGLDVLPGMDSMPGTRPGRRNRRRRSESPQPIPQRDSGSDAKRRAAQSLNRPKPLKQHRSQPPGRPTGPPGSSNPSSGIVSTQAPKNTPPRIPAQSNRMGSQSSSSAGGSSPPKTKWLCLKEIRKPGRNYETILSLVQSVTAKDERRALVDELIMECKRHRKTELISKLQTLV